MSCLVLAEDSPIVYPDGELGKMVKLGEDIVNNTATHPLIKDLVGNSLTCKNCHLAGEDGRVGTSKKLSIIWA